MPDLIIKPKNQSGNKLILQDQAGGAVLTTADSGATIANATLTTPTIANMANCTFPSTHPDTTVVKTDWVGDVTGTTETVTGAYVSWTNKRASSTVIVNVDFSYNVWRSGGSKTFRAFYVWLYYSTSSVADGATSSFGTNISRVLEGRKLAGDDASDKNHYGSGSIKGSFTSGSAGTTYYFGISQGSIESDVRHQIKGGGTTSEDGNGPLLTIYELQ
jgi:hypothetical protein